MLPLRDSIPSSRPPVVTVTIIATCALVFIWEMLLGEQGLARLTDSYALVPRELFSLRAYLVQGIWPAVPLVTSMFLHGGVVHIAANMLFLWVFGDNVEDRMGHGRFFLFYLACGVAGNLAHALLNFHSATPSLGASGAIAGVMAAYVMLFPGAGIRGLALILFYPVVIELPSWFFIGYWFVLQLLSGVGTIGVETGVAFFAHIGGFVAGLYLARWFVGLRGRGPRIRRFEVVD